MKQSVKNKAKAGFTLVELMVVVAIIGILAVVAVPNFNRFQGKARQASAKTELAGIYTAQRAFQVEANTFHANLQMLGFQSEGNNADGTAIPNIVQEYALTAANAPADCTIAVPNQNPTNAFAAGCMYQADANAIAGAAAVPTTIVAPLISGVPTAANFTGIAVGNIGGQQQDVWTINENKTLANALSGL